MDETKKPAVDSEKHGNKNILLGTILGYLSLALSIASGLIYTPWIIQSIGKSNYGLYTLCLSLINLFLLDFGLGTATNAFLSKYRAKGENEKVSHFLGVVSKLYCLIDLAIICGFVIAYFLIDYLYIGLTADERANFKIVFLISASFSSISFPATVFNGVISAYEEFIWEKIVDISNKICFVIFTAIAIVNNWGLLGLVVINSSIGLLCLIIKFLIIHFKLSIHFDWKAPFEKNELREILVFSIWSAIANVASRLVFNITPSILGIVSNSTNIAVFGVITSLEGYVYTFGSVMSGFFLPKITRLSSQNESVETTSSKLNELAIKVGRIEYSILCIAEVGFACCGKEFILIWMKGDTTYITAYYGTLMIILYQLIFVPQLVFDTAMYAQNHVKQVAIASISKAILNVGLSFLLSYYYGALGASIAIAISRIFELILRNLFYKKYLGVNLKLFFSKVYLRISIDGVLCLSLGLLLHFFLPFEIRTNFLIEVPSILVFYTAILFAFILTKQEKKELFSFLKRNK